LWGGNVLIRLWKYRPQFTPQWKPSCIYVRTAFFCWVTEGKAKRIWTSISHRLPGRDQVGRATHINPNHYCLFTADVSFQFFGEALSLMFGAYMVRKFPISQLLISILIWGRDHTRVATWSWRWWPCILLGAALYWIYDYPRREIHWKSKTGNQNTAAA
jgi:hypothetical protein